MDRSVPDLLQPPLLPLEIARLESELPFLLTIELETIYGWRNGTKAATGDVLHDLYFLPGFYFLSLEEAVQTFHEKKDGPQWQENWFPLFADGAGDFYVVPCSSKKLRSSGIIGFIHGEPEQPTEFESLAAMVKTIDAALEAGAIFTDEDNCLEVDDDRFREIAHRFNPSIREWQP